MRRQLLQWEIGIAALGLSGWGTGVSVVMLWVIVATAEFFGRVNGPL